MLLKEEIDLDVLPFGLLELDAYGSILYYRPEVQEHPGVSASALVGLNLLTDVMPIAQDGEFRDRVRRFRRSHVPADSFHLTLRSEGSSVRVKVLLARIREQSEAGVADTVLMHIRKA